MKHYDFDQIIDRSHSDAIKYCNLDVMFGKSDIIPLWIADMDFKVCPEISQALSHRIEHPIYGYAAVSPTFFSSIAQWIHSRHNFDVAEYEITFVAGVVKGIAYAVNYFTNPGDKILIQPPVYHPFRAVIEGNKRVAVTNPLRFTGDGYEMDLDDLRHKIETEKPKMMILCNPHNPIGIAWSPDTLRQVAEICADNGVIVVSDEIHSDLTLGSHHHTPFLSVSDKARQIGIMLGAPSKTFNIPGMVSSWCVVKNPELRKDYFSWLTVNDFSSPTFFAMTATEAAYHNGEQWLAEALRYISDNIEYISRELPRISGGRIRAVRPEASFLIWVDCRDMGMTHEELTRFFIEKAGLGLNSGEMFGKEGRGFMRLNVATPRCILREAVDRIEKALSQI